VGIVARIGRLLVPSSSYHDSLGATASKRTVVGIIVLSALLLWAILPAFIEDTDWVLSLTVSPGLNSDCPTGSACFTFELRNRGLWPITVEITELQFYPSLVGPSLEVKWMGLAPETRLVLMPFGGSTYTFSLGLLGGFEGPERIYVIMKANIVVLYVSREVVLHSGKR
jgi:hypothetical protein